MSLHPDIDIALDIAEDGVEDVVALVVAWQAPLLPAGQVADARTMDDPVPFILVDYVTGTENEEEGTVDDVVALHCLYPKGPDHRNRTYAKQFTGIVHRRMRLLAQTLDNVPIGGRQCSLDYVNVFKRFSWEPYGDETILRRIGQYRIGQTREKLS